MKWQFVELQKYKTEALQFNEVVDLKDEITTTFGDVILDVTPLTVTGFEMPIDFDIDEVYLQDEAHADRYEIEDSVILVEDGVIDFNQALAEYVALSVPLQVLTEEEQNQPMPEGNGWAVISEDDFDKKKEEEPVQANTPLAGLADLFKDED